MPTQITPTIATKQQVYDYCGITAGLAALNVGSAAITWANWIQRELDVTAWQIVQYLDYDFTTAQVQMLRFVGEGQTYIDVNYPVSTITAFTSFDPTNPSGTVTNIGTAALALSDTNNPFRIYRIDKNDFQPGLDYYIALTQAADTRLAGWPMPIIQIQIEMIATIIKESDNGRGILNESEYEGLLGRPIKYKDVYNRFLQQLRPWRRIAI